MGASLSLPGGISKALQNESVVDKMRAMGYKSPVLSDEEIAKIMEDLDNASFEEAI